MCYKCLIVDPPPVHQTTIAPHKLPGSTVGHPSDSRAFCILFYLMIQTFGERPTDVGGSRGDRSSVERDKLGGIKPHLNDVIDESDQRRQWERGDEQRYETKLRHCIQHSTAINQSRFRIVFF